MGIPFYFKNIVRNNPGILTSQVPPCDRLYLDYNSIIHTCSAKVVASKPWRNKNAMEEAIFRKVISYTEHIASMCKPSQLLYIGVDGVAPVAKIMQQRRRRHMSAMRNTFIDDYKRKHGIFVPEWDSNCITPGTTFMVNLQHALETHFKERPRPYQVIISSHEQEGEGEHKIIRYIKSLGNDGFSDVIYGLDADLMMLALTCGKQKLYLMRESPHFGGRRGDVTSFKYVVMDYLMTCISKDQQYVFDYVFVCFFLGNDFLPHFYSISMKSNGLDVLTSLLARLHHQGMRAILFDETKRVYTLNIAFLQAMLKYLAEAEEEMLTHNIRHHLTFCQKSAANAAPEQQSPLDAFTYDFEHEPTHAFKKYPVTWCPEEDPVAWKSMYYKHFSVAMGRHAAEDVDDMCANFLQGLTWNIDYYFNNVSSNTWWYATRVAPCISDVSLYLEKLIASENVGEMYAHTNITPFTLKPVQQLMLVLPYQSFKLLPVNARNQLLNIENGLAYMYPIAFRLDKTLKCMTWECVPMLPDVDVHKIINVSKLLR